MAALIAGMAQGLQGLFGDLIDRWCRILPNSVSRRLREGFVAGHMLMMQPAFAVVFWCEPERQQSGLAVLEEGHLAMRR